MRWSMTYDKMVTLTDKDGGITKIRLIANRSHTYIVPGTLVNKLAYDRRSQSSFPQ